MTLLERKQLEKDFTGKKYVQQKYKYDSLGRKIEIYNSINDDYDCKLLHRRQWESWCELMHGDILYDKDGTYQSLKEDFKAKKTYLPPYIHTLKLNH